MISLIHPSRGRPQKAYATARYWHERAAGEFEHILSLDNSDKEARKYEMHFAEVVIIDNHSSVVEATNHAAKHAAGDILLYLSDDFKCPDNWASLIEKEFEGVTEPMLLKVDDELQKFEVGIVTIPIMNRALYEKLGYMWHPEYKSMWVDCDLFETCKRINAIKYAPHLKFPHEHPSNGKAQNDETYTRSAANWDQGKKVFMKRSRQGFPI
jgi:hypothetical protein